MQGQIYKPVGSHGCFVAGPFLPDFPGISQHALEAFETLLRNNSNLHPDEVSNLYPERPQKNDDLDKMNPYLYGINGLEQPV